MSVTIWERVSAALTPLGLPMAANVFIVASGAALPAQYLVYSLISSPPEQFADNAETLRSYLVQVSAYSRSGSASLPNIKTAMTAAGFIAGPMRDLPYDDQLRYFGLAMDFYYSEGE